MSSHVFVDRKISTENYLMVFIRELELQEKEYEAFQLKVNNDKWVDIPILFSNNYETGKIKIETPDKNIRYKIDGRFKFKGEWVDITGGVFAPILHKSEGINTTIRPAISLMHHLIENEPKIEAQVIHSEVAINNG